MNDNVLLKLALDVGEIMITSGAETPRVEDTMMRILSISGNQGAEAVALSTLLIASLPSENHGSLTLTRGVRSRSINFERICMMNSLSRGLVSGEISLEEATLELKNVKNTARFPLWLIILAYAAGAFGFCAMLNGSIADATASLFCGGLIGFFVVFLQGKSVPYFLGSFVGGGIAAAMALVLCHFFAVLNINTIIVGSIFPLLPGVVMTNAIRDIMEGNFISGTSKLMEALLVAVAIACGVGLSLSYIHL